MSPVELNLSLQEKEHRWSAVREEMARQGLAAMLVYGDNVAAKEVACRYLTNMSIDCNCKHILIFPVDRDPILLVAVSSVNVFFSKRLSWVPPQNISRSFNMGADLASKLNSLNLQKSRIGIENPREWPAGDYNTLKDSCPGIELVDATPLLTEIRRPKSREELQLMQEGIRIGELAQRAFLENLKDGRTEEEVVGKVEDVIRANGVERRFWLICSNPELPYPFVPGDSMIQRPNPVAFSAEFQRTRGYACQVVRTFCWEEPKGDYKRMWDLWRELRKMVVKEFRPGRSVAELAGRVEDTVDEWGFECDYVGHGLGVSIFDAPAFNAKQERESSQVLKTNEVFVFHPMIKSKGCKPPLAWVADMYLTGEKETKWMTPFFPGLPEMIPR